MRTVLIVVFGGISMLFAGCATIGIPAIPLTETSVNANYFGSTKETPKVLFAKSDALKARAENLKYAMTRTQTFEMLGMDESSMPNVLYLPRPTLRDFLLGLVHIHTKAEGNELAELVTQLSGVQIPFVSMKRSVELAAPFHLKYRDKGDNLVLTMIFKNDMLYSVLVSGDRNIDKTLKSIYVNPLDGSFAAKAFEGWARNSIGQP